MTARPLPSRTSESGRRSTKRATDEPGPAGCIVSESGRKRRSHGDRAGSAGPLFACPSLLLVLASLLARHLAGSLLAPYSRAAQLSRGLIGTFRSSADCSPTRAGAGKTTPFDVDGPPVHGRRARVTSRAHNTLHASRPPGSTPTQARASAAGGFGHWPWRRPRHPARTVRLALCGVAGKLLGGNIESHDDTVHNRPAR